MEDAVPEPQGNHPARRAPATHGAFKIALVVQVLVALVIAFGDIGFDHPGRFGLDYDDFLGLTLLWFLSVGAGFVFAWGNRRKLGLQCLVFCAIAGGAALAAYLRIPRGPVEPAEVQRPPR